MLELQPVLIDNRLQFPHQRFLRIPAITRPLHILAPVLQCNPPTFQRTRIFIRHIIHLPTKGVQGGHGFASWFFEGDEGQC